jgi:hypothetical protein
MRRTDLKEALEDLVDRTGRVEDMLDVLASIYRERARHVRYRVFEDQMLATAHVLHEASEAVARIFGEGQDEALERAAGRAAWQAAHEAGRRNPAEITIDTPTFLVLNLIEHGAADENEIRAELEATKRGREVLAGDRRAPGRQIDTLERLGLIRFVDDRAVITQRARRGPIRVLP